MKSFINDIGKYLFGTSTTQQCDEGLALCRMNAALAKVYGSTESAIIRAECTTNVRLRFRTDSQSIGLSLRFGAAARLIYATDISVKGFDSISVSPLDPSNGLEASIRLPGNGMRDITIHFPHLVKTWLKDVLLDDEASIEPAAPLDGRMIFIGDSIFQGMTASSPTRTLATIASTLLNKDVVNVAVGGAVMDANAIDNAKDYGADMALINFGINDYAQNLTLAQFTEKTEVSAKALANGPWKPFAISPIPYPGDPGSNTAGNTLDEFRKAFSDIMHRHPSITLLDGYEIMPNDKECYIDSCHPNDIGSLIYGNAIARAIKLMG